MDSRRWRWLVEQTGEDTTRGIAAACGVSHTTIGRWLAKGIPMNKLTELMFRFHCDPIEACVIWGYLTPEQVGGLNWEAFAHYMPFSVLVEEVHRREKPYAKGWPDKMRKTITPAGWG